MILHHYIQVLHDFLLSKTTIYSPLRVNHCALFFSLSLFFFITLFILFFNFSPLKNKFYIEFSGDKLLFFFFSQFHSLILLDGMYYSCYFILKHCYCYYNSIKNLTLYLFNYFNRTKSFQLQLMYVKRS